MSAMWRRVASNAMANIFMGGSATIFQIGVTALAARIFDTAHFAAWTLALSLSALTPLFAANLASIVTRQLVAAENQADASALVMASARKLARQLGLFALVAIAIIAVILLFNSAPLVAFNPLVFILAAVVLTLGQLWQVELQPEMGWHYARQHNWTVAGSVTLSRGLSLVGMAIAAWLFRNNLVMTAICLAAGTWAGFAAAITKGFQGERRAVSDPPAQAVFRKESLRLVRGFAVWSLGAAVVQYGLPPFMSVISGGHYNAFFLAYTLNMIVIGVGSAGASALLAPVTRLLASGATEKLVRWMNWAPAFSALMLIAGLGILLVGIEPLIHFWAPGKAVGSDVRGYLFLLGFQTIARLMALVFSVMLTAGGNGAQLRISILIELFLTLVIALPAGWFYGDHLFIIMLAGTGLIAALSTAVTTLKMMSLERRIVRSIMARFALLEAVGLGLWYVFGMINQ